MKGDVFFYDCVVVLNGWECGIKNYRVLIFNWLFYENEKVDFILLSIFC